MRGAMPPTLSRLTTLLAFQVASNLRKRGLRLVQRWQNRLRLRRGIPGQDRQADGGARTATVRTSSVVVPIGARRRLAWQLS